MPLKGIPVASELRDKPTNQTPAEWWKAAAAARDRHLDAANDIAEKGRVEGREKFLASEQRDYDEHVNQVTRFDHLMADIVRANPELNEVDRRGVVPPAASATDRGVPLLAPKQQFASWPSVRASNEPDGELRLGAMIRGWASGRWDGAEREMNALSEGTSTAGGVLVPAPLAARFIDRARNAARVIQAGATTVPMDSRTLAVPRLTGSSAPAWRNENAAVAEGDLTMDSITLTARSMAFLVKTSRELVEDSSPGVIGVIEDDLAAQVALEWDRVALRGTGTAPEPRGVRNTSGVTVTAFGGANGGTPTNYDPFIDAEQAVRANNFEPSAHILSTRTQTTARKMKEATTNAYLQPPDMKPWLITNQIPGNLTAGTSTDTSEVYTGEWRHLYLGVRTGPLLFQLVERYADVGQIAFLIWFRGDIAAAQPGAFTVTTGVKP